MNEFIKNNLQPILDAQVDFYPPVSFISLRLALKNYYETYSIIRDKTDFEYFIYRKEKLTINTNRSHGFIERYFASINFLHTFYEHLVNEALLSANPNLTKVKFDNEVDFIKLLTQKYGDIKVKGSRTLDHRQRLERLQLLIANFKGVPKQFKVQKKYHFLLKHIETMTTIATLRNDIIHEGKSYLNRYAYEVLFINHVIPLVKDTLRLLPKSKVYISRSVYCKINIIRKLCSLQLAAKVEGSISQALLKKLQFINHLKELGRASFNNPLWMQDDTKNESTWKSINEGHNNPIRLLNEAVSEIKTEKFGFHTLHNCPCCGSNTLLTNDYWYYYATKIKRVETASCQLCTYKINIMLGEPKYFGITTDLIFSDVTES